MRGSVVGSRKRAMKQWPEFDPTNKQQFDISKDMHGHQIGRTVQFTEEETGSINYPSNHYKNVCGGIQNLTLYKILFEGTQWTSGDDQSVFDPTNQVDPNSPITKKKTSTSQDGGGGRLLVE